MEAFKKITSHFYYINIWELHIREVDLQLYNWDGLYTEGLLIPFKEELNQTMLSLTENDRISYLKVLLSFSPLYYRNENLTEDTQYIRDFINGNTSVNPDPLRRAYILFTYELWNEALNLIKESCHNFNIGFNERQNNMGITDLFFGSEVNNQVETQPIKTDIQNNPYPKIFKNLASYQMFIELKELTVTENIVADYSFIYHKLINEKLGAINDTVTHPIFINFLKKEYELDISANKLPFKDPKNKQPLYTTILNKYIADIVK